MEGSDIIDLVDDPMRLRKTSNPTSRQEFSRILYEINILREYNGNKTI